MNNYLQHQNHLNTTTLKLQKRFPNARFYSRHVGKFYNQRIFDSLRKINSFEELRQWLFATKNKFLISINKPGMSDQYAIFPTEINGIIIPIHIEIESKTFSGKLSASQKAWEFICKKNHIPYFVSRNDNNVGDEIEAYLIKVSNKKLE